MTNNHALREYAEEFQPLVDAANEIERRMCLRLNEGHHDTCLMWVKDNPPNYTGYKPEEDLAYMCPTCLVKWAFLEMERIENEHEAGRCDGPSDRDLELAAESKPYFEGHDVRMKDSL